MGEPIGIDSNALTYLIEATGSAYDPARDDPDLARERVAMIRIFLYADRGFWVPPTVRQEYGQIRDPYLFTRHDSVTGNLLLDHDSGVPEAQISARVAALEATRASESDRRVLAEVELMGLGTLLTYDRVFARRVHGSTAVLVTRPSEFWTTLGVAPGTDPILTPVSSNSLSGVTWWRV